MICYICEKETEEILDEAFFQNPVRSDQNEKYYVRKYGKDDGVLYGFHMECLKDSLGDDFGLFFEEVKKKKRSAKTV